MSCRRRSSVPSPTIEKIIIFDNVTNGDTQTVTFVALLGDNSGGIPIVMKTKDVQSGTSSSKLFKTQTSKAEFLVVDKAAQKSGRTKNNSRVGLAVGLIITAIVCVTLFLAVWYIKKRFIFVLVHSTPLQKSLYTFLLSFIFVDPPDFFLL